MKYNLDDVDAPWTEDDHQLVVAQWLRRHGYVFAADQNAGKRSKKDGAKRKLMGMTAGEPDIRVYLPYGRLCLIELKKWKGRRPKTQMDRHEALSAVGHPVHTIEGRTPHDTIVQLEIIMAAVA